MITDEEHMAAEAAAVKVGARVSVNPGGKLGEVMFVGRGLPSSTFQLKVSRS